MLKNNTDKGMFTEKNKLVSILIIVGAIVLLIGVYFWYQNVYLKGRAVEANESLAKIEQYILVDSLSNKALNGEAGNMGLLKIAETFENTKPANLANYYIGSIYLRQGKFKEAISALQKYAPTASPILDPLALGLQGDAYSELKDYDKAAQFYQKAIEKSSNEVTSPLYLKKLALVKEQTKDYKAAATSYKKIKALYPQSNEAKNIDAAITKAETLAGN